MLDYPEISRILGKYLSIFCFFLLVPIGAALYFEKLVDPQIHPQPHSLQAFLWTLLINVSLALLFSFLGKNGSKQLARRESIFLVVSIWIMTALVSACPFYLSRTLTNPIDAYFEAMSGLTTTGSTMICPKAYHPETAAEISLYYTNPHVPTSTYSFQGTVPPIRDPATGLVLYSGVEAVSKAILLWRSFLQWLGGMGIVLICLTILPALGVGGKFLYQMESTGPIKQGIQPRVKETASNLWKLYLLFTIVETALLFFTNSDMPFFDALCTSFSTISTGGFSVRNENIASYQSVATESIVFFFMILGSINFALYFQIFKEPHYPRHAPDFFLFLAILLIGCMAVSSFLIGEPGSGLGGTDAFYSWKEAFRQGSFQAVSVQTSTGFITANYDRWPFAPQMFMLLLMFIGGMSGSTAGGIKTSRFYILYKIVLHRLESLYRPDSVRKLKIGTSEIDDKNALTVLAFFCIVAFFTVIGIICLVLDGIDPETSLGLIACMMNNVGLAFRAAGPTDSLTFLSNFSKLLSIGWMLLGRLEFYVVLLLFLPSFWKNR
ncbi:MAG: TrkH family potassium uptake protein [Chlamydiales bacterium]|nr:TrkH family potassium uptake protein [Chlamydiales bacterium]